MPGQKLILCILLAAFGPSQIYGQGVKVLTLEEALKKDEGLPREQQDRYFSPHKVAGNLYYVGTAALSSYLVTTPEGHILINSTFERTVPLIRTAVAELGFRFEDIKIVLGSHAHNDHMEADALIRQITGAKVMAMDRDVPLLETIRPGGKKHPVDRVLRHLEEVKLGGSTVVAHRTAGHTPGNTTFTMKIQEGGRSYDVVIVGSMRLQGREVLVNNKDYPNIVEDFVESFKYSRSLPCDIFLSSHPDKYNMTEKHANMGKGPNPFIDPQGYLNELKNNEIVFNLKLEQQKK